MSAVTKPPLGVMPRYIWVGERIVALQQAIKCYAEELRIINPEWVEEYNQLITDREKLGLYIFGKTKKENDNV